MSYYIVVIDNVRYGEPGESDYHIEKLLTLNSAIECLNNDDNYNDYRRFFIVTNDEYLLRKYVRVLCLKEFEDLCNPEVYPEESMYLRFGQHHVEGLFKNLQILIENEKLFSFNMKWTSTPHQPWDNFGPTEYHTEFDSWEFNTVFKFLTTPIHYKNIFDSNGTLSLPRFKKTDLNRINKLFNTIVLEIKNHSFPQLTWTEANGYLKYYDKISHLRLFVKKENLTVIEKHPEAMLHFETLIDKNGYIELYLTHAVSSNGEFVIDEASILD